MLLKRTYGNLAYVIYFDVRFKTRNQSNLMRVYPKPGEVGITQSV